MKKRGFTLVELMVVVAIIAILASISLPMYTRFKQKAAAFGPIKVLGGATSTLQGYHSEYGSFAGIILSGATSKLENASGVDVGVNLPPLQDVTYIVSPLSDEELKITWSWAGTSCPDITCGGHYCLYCSSDGSGCMLAIKLNSITLGLDRSTDSSYTDC